jgi:4-aminobutyrate aminotransferase
MVGLELHPPPSAPAGCSARLQRACRERGLLLLTASVFETLRFIPPLTVAAAETDHGVMH